MSGVEQALNEELAQVRDQIAGYMIAPESEVPSWAKLVALAIRESAVMREIAGMHGR